MVKAENVTLGSSISEGETGGLSVREPLRGPLLCDSLPEVRGDTSCCKRGTQIRISTQIN